MQILRLDPALDQLIAPGTVPEAVSGGYVFTEGPMWRGGRLWFSDEEGDKVHALAFDGQHPAHDTVLLDFTQAPLAQPNGNKTGPNAMATAQDGTVIMAEQYGRAVIRLVQGLSTEDIRIPGGSGTLQVQPFFDSYQGKHLNSPNDLVFLSDGSFFFTDPPYGLRGFNNDPAKELPFNGVFHYAAGKLTAVITDLPTPNGIALSPDNRTLYVNNSGPDQRVVAYDLHPDGTVGAARNVIAFTGHEGPGVPDGLKIDSRGNLWTTSPGGIRIVTPQGKVLGQIQLPETAANAAWGGSDGKTLYITARTHIYRLQTLVQGNLPAFLH